MFSLPWLFLLSIKTVVITLLLTISKQKLGYFVHKDISSAAKSSEIEIIQHLIHNQTNWISRNKFELKYIKVFYIGSITKCIATYFLEKVKMFYVPFRTLPSKKNSVEESCSTKLGIQKQRAMRVTVFMVLLCFSS